MGRTPTLPSGTPPTANGWQYDPDPYNGNAWFDHPRDTAVFVYPVATGEETIVWLKDERVSGLHHVELVRTTYDTAVEIAVRWMHQNRPSDWTHPHVHEPALHPPPGWSLDDYQLGAQQDTIRYTRDDPPADCRSQVLQIQGYRSSGNYEFGIVDRPTRRARHIGDCLERSVPAKSGLDVAIAMAFDHATTILDAPTETPPARGQTTFSSFQA